MATWAPISNTVPQYYDAGVAASGFYLKFYVAGTTTPTSMATDSTGGTTLAKCQINSEGYPINGSNAVFVPHVDRTYKIILYRNATDADNNTTANAVWEVDSLYPVSTSGDSIDEVGSIASLIAGSWSQNQLYVSSYYDPSLPSVAGPKGGHYIHKTGATNAVPTVGAAVSVSTIGTGAQAGYYWDADGDEWYISIRNQTVNVFMYGATGDGVTDDTAAIQAAINFCFSSGSPFPKLHIPSGNYLVTGELDRSGNGNYTDIVGDGQRNTIITVSGAASVFNSVLLLANPADIAGRTTVSDLTIDCNNRANYGIDAQSMRSWTLANVEIRNAVVAGGIGGNWSTDILNNRFSDNPIGWFNKNIVSNPSATNGSSFKFNYVVDCPVGFQSDALFNDKSITDNVFDTCVDAGIWIKEGARKCLIDDNYFESCGTGTGVTVDIAGPSTETIAAPVVLAYNPSTTSATFNGSVDKNYFVTCNTSRLVAAYNIGGLSVLGNKVLSTESYSSFVELREEGVSNSNGGGGLQIAGYYPGITKLVELNGLSKQDNHCNLEIDHKQTAAATVPKAVLNNPTRSDWSGSTTINEAFYGGFKEFEFDVVADGSSVDKVFSVDFTLLTDHPLLGRYVRLHYQTKGTSTNTGVRCRVSISGVTEVDIQRSGTSYVEAGRGITLYIPSSATSFEVRLDGLSNSQNAKMIGFCVCDASIPVAEIPLAHE